jgi:tRNA1(Val) A37 N6-methylase TrmN6
MSNKFSNLSLQLTKQLNNNTKKKNGIYFTPQSIVKKTVDKILKYSSNNNIKIKTVLEPSCGSGEFINYIDKKFNNIDISCIEYNKTIFNSVKKIKSKNNIKFYNKDFLKFNTGKYDLIIGNPPYYVMKSEDTNNRYKNYYEGRPNIFVLFIAHSLSLLKNGGILAFILPKSWTNCLYYNKLREHINKNYCIIDIIDCSNHNYIDTEQDTIIFIIHKIKCNNKLSLLLNNKYILFQNKSNINKIKKLLIGSTTLDKLGFDISVGTILWNEHKKLLTSNSKKTRLIYSTDIQKGKIVYKNFDNPEKKNFISLKGSINPVIIVNRGYGTGKYQFNYALLNTNNPYLLENHIISIAYNQKISKNKLISLYKKIIQSFDNKKTKEFIKLYFGNSAINTTELKYILPIYIT